MTTSTASQAPEKTSAPAPWFTTPIPWWQIIMLLVMGGVTIFACLQRPKTNFVSEPGVVMNLPNSVGSFWGIDQEVSEAEKVILPPDTQFAKKSYSSIGDDKINCQIVLAGAEKRSIHRPEICLPGQGWNIKSREVIDVPLKNGGSLPVMKLLISRPAGPNKELTAVFLYWFVGKDVSTPSHAKRILKTSWDLIFHNTNHRWAYVIVSSPVLQVFTPNGKDQQQTLDMLTEFIRDAAPEFMLSYQKGNTPKP